MLSIERAHMAGGELLRGHRHRAPHLLVVASGDLADREGRAVRELSAGSFRLSCAAATHDLAFGSDGAVCLLLQANGPFWRRLFGRALEESVSCFGTATDIAALAAADSAESLAASRESLMGLGRILAHAGGAAERTPDWLEEALDLIDAGADKAVGRIASALARDRVHFSRAFGRALGFRPAEYRSVRRVSIALTMIKTSDESLVDIALSCGYAHQSHMNRAFKALYGRTPSSWRS